MLLFEVPGLYLSLFMISVYDKAAFALSRIFGYAYILKTYSIFYKCVVLPI